MAEEKKRLISEDVHFEPGIARTFTRRRRSEKRKKPPVVQKEVLGEKRNTKQRADRDGGSPNKQRKEGFELSGAGRKGKRAWKGKS